ncbi:hypothetical protein Vretimale_8677, partial [Volvox reticuliferus]
GMAMICSFGTGGGGGGGAIAEDLTGGGSSALAAAVTRTPSASLASLGPAAARGRQLLKSGIRRCDSQDAFTRIQPTRAHFGVGFRQTAAGISTAAGAIAHVKPTPGSFCSATAAVQQQQLQELQQPPLEPALVRTPLRTAQAPKRARSGSLHARGSCGNGTVGLADTAIGKLALVLAAEGSAAQSMGEVGTILGTAMASMGATFNPPGMLHAKAFKLSHTLLQHLIEDGGSNGGGFAGGAVTDSLGAGKYGSSGTTHMRSCRKGHGDLNDGDDAAAISSGGGARPVGFIVSSCSRWVQDVRHPSRDLCLLMLAGSGPRGSGNASSELYGAPGPAPASASSVKSLVLLCVGASRTAGIFLGLYLTFPAQLPVRLLEAVQGSCGELLHRVFGRVVQMKLREELSNEVDTLRLGVPGSYAVVPSLMMSSNFSRGDRDRGDPETASCGGNSTLSGGIALGTAPVAAPGGEVRPPGRLAKTITMTQLEVGTGGSFSGQSTFDDPLCTAYTAGLGAGGDAGANPAATDLISDLILNEDSSALTKPKVQRSVAMPTMVATTGCAHTLNAATEAAANRASRGSLLPIVNGFSLNGMLPAALGPVAGRRDQIVTNKGATSVSSGPGAVVPIFLGTTGNVSGGGSVRIVDQSLSGDLICTATADFVTGPGAATAASVLTVQEADATCSMRAHFGLLVESLLGTIRSTTAPTTSGTSPEDASHATTTVPFTTGFGTRVTCRSIGASVGNPEDLEDIQLYDILGEGASGVVLRGMMGTVPVATKLIEIPQLEDSDEKQRSAAGYSAADTKATKEHMNARHTMYRNAMELAVLKSTTHVNIVRCLGIFDNIILEHMQNPSGAKGCVLRRATAANTGTPPGSPICTAIVTELCDGCLSTVLADRTFPRVITITHTSS